MDNVCTVDECTNTHAARGFCRRHYVAWHRGKLRAEAREARVKEIRICEQCGGQIPATRRKNVMYCSPLCKRRAQYAKEKARPEPRKNPPCEVDGCPTPRVVRGLCHKHYMRLRSKGTTDDVRKNARGTCSVDTCDRAHVGHGLCQKHLARTKAGERRQQRLDAKAGRTCLNCDAALDGRRSTAIFCSKTCKDAERVATGRSAEASLRYYFSRRYGLTPEQVEAMAAEGCGICGTTEWTGRHRRPHVDHCHETGAIRGILCHGCNVSIGHFRDDIELLRAAIVYLERLGALRAADNVAA